MQREHQEGPSPTRFYDDGHESGVDSTKGTVPGDSRNADVVIALVILHRLSKDVPEFALPHHSPHCVYEKQAEMCVRASRAKAAPPQQASWKQRLSAPSSSLLEGANPRSSATGAGRARQNRWQSSQHPEVEESAHFKRKIKAGPEGKSTFGVGGKTQSTLPTLELGKHLSEGTLWVGS